MRRTRHIFLCVLAAALLMAAARQGAAAAGGEDEVIALCAQGLSSDDAGWKECALGDYVADAVRREAGTAVSLIPAGCLGMALVGDGEITRREAAEALRGDFPVRIYNVSSRQLKELLEQGVSAWVLSEKERLDPAASASDGYLQISGMEVKYDASAPVGERVLLVTVAGKTLDLTVPDDSISVSAPAALKMGVPGTDAGRTMARMLCDYMEGQGTVTPAEGARVQVIGANAANIITVVPPWIVLFVVVMIGMNAVLKHRREDAFSKDN